MFESQQEDYGLHVSNAIVPVRAKPLVDAISTELNVSNYKVAEKFVGDILKTTECDSEAS